MALSAVRVDHNRIGGFEHRIVFDPMIVVHLHIQARNILEAFLEKHATGIEFVVAWPVAWFPGDQDEFFVGRLLSQSGRRENQRAEANAREQTTKSEEFHMIAMHHVPTFGATDKLQEE
jgi:hypothetical protein